MAKGIASLFKMDMSKWDLVSIGNKTEHDFLGVKSGILDQFASVFGKMDRAMMMDCRSKEFEYVPLHLGEYGFVVINSMVKHTHTTSGYLDRVKECGQAVEFFNTKYGNIDSLRDVTERMLAESENQLKSTAFKRARFIVEENTRVIAFKDAFMSANFKEAGNLLNACHTGLSDLYQVSCKELDLLANIAQSHSACLGSRMMGGGFGGCTLNLVHRSQQKDFINAVQKKYKSQINLDPEIYLLNVVDGVSELKK
jgi:galactokinase